MVELCLACSFDSVAIAAVEDGICVPDPEDVLLDPTFFAARAQRWKNFAEWYVLIWKAGQSRALGSLGMS